MRNALPVANEGGTKRILRPLLPETGQRVEKVCCCRRNIKKDAGEHALLLFQSLPYTRRPGEGRGGVGLRERVRRTRSHRNGGPYAEGRQAFPFRQKDGSEPRPALCHEPRNGKNTKEGRRAPPENNRAAASRRKGPACPPHGCPAGHGGSGEIISPEKRFLLPSSPAVRLRAGASLQKLFRSLFRGYGTAPPCSSGPSSGIRIGVFRLAGICGAASCSAGQRPLCWRRRSGTEKRGTGSRSSGGTSSAQGDGHG